MPAITAETLELLRANQRFLAAEMLRRGIVLDYLSERDQVLRARFGAHVEYLIEIDSSIMPFPAARISEDKFLTKQILTDAGVAVPRGQQFCFDQRFAALAYALELSWPLVLKPVCGTHGDDAYMPLRDVGELNRAMELFFDARGNAPFLIEEFFEGQEYRVLVTRRGEYAVVHREPAYVIGDGYSTIEVLAEEETYRRMNPRTSCLCEIVLDEAAACFLEQSGRSFATVPGKGEKVMLRANSNLKKGGTCGDVTDEVHASVIEICRRILAAFPGMPYAGIDFMSSAIGREHSYQTYRVLEVNSVPAIGLHINPWRGKSRNAAAWLVDMIFPETEGRSA